MPARLHAHAMHMWTETCVPAAAGSTEGVKQQWNIDNPPPIQVPFPPAPTRDGGPFAGLPQQPVCNAPLALAKPHPEPWTDSRVAGFSSTVPPSGQISPNMIRPFADSACETLRAIEIPACVVCRAEAADATHSGGLCAKCMGDPHAGGSMAN